MNIDLEIIKLKQQNVCGSLSWVIAEEDFIRLISKHKLTLQKLIALGISRNIWDNTLAFYGWDVNRVEGFRKSPYSESRHGNSNYGFSSVLPIHEGRPTDSNALKYVEHIGKFFPGFPITYGTYHENPTEVSKALQDISRQIIELNGVVKAVHHRIRKWAERTDKPYHKLQHSVLNHKFSKILDELGISYKLEFKVKNSYFDFYIPSHKLLIEVDGGGHRKDKDPYKEELVSPDFKLIRFKVHDTIALKHNYERIKDKISKECWG